MPAQRKPIASNNGGNNQSALPGETDEQKAQLLSNTAQLEANQNFLIEQLIKILQENGQSEAQEIARLIVSSAVIQGNDLGELMAQQQSIIVQKALTRYRQIIQAPAYLSPYGQVIGSLQQGLNKNPFQDAIDGNTIDVAAVVSNYQLVAAKEDSGGSTAAE